MSKKRKPTKYFNNPQQPEKAITSLLDAMVDGREFESLLTHKSVNVNLVEELRKSINEIQSITQRQAICYLGNVINPNIKANISINQEDDLPFSEMINSIDEKIKEIDIILVTPGGSGQQVAKFVDKLRPRFNKVNFIIPNIAMSAGTIFAMSGNKIFMGPNSYIGPVDPQVPNRDGRFVPAQALKALIDDIQKRGEEYIKKSQNPPWADIQLLRQIDSKELGAAITASEYSIEIVENFLKIYKFSEWTTHNSSGKPVTQAEKDKRANEIAQFLCDHRQWKSHSRGITREVAWDECKLQIDHFESTKDLNRTCRRFWALLNWIFENTSMAKIYISDNYCIIRNDNSLSNQKR